MKHFLFIIMAFCFATVGFAQTQERGMQEIKVIYKFPAKGSEDAKTNTLQKATLKDKNVHLLLLDSNNVTIVLQSGKKFIFKEVDENNFTEGTGTSGVFRLPKIESNVVVKGAFMSLQVFKKGMVLTDENGKKKYFKLTNVDSFPLEKVTESTGSSSSI